MVNPYTAVAAAVAAAAVAFYNYNEQLDRQKERTKQFTGLDGMELDSLRNGIKATADVMGKEFNDVLQAVDGLMSKFAIDGETALSIINAGFIAGADDAGNMLSLLDRYSGSFRSIGISASELTALIAQTRSGIFAEDGLAIIEKAGIQLRNMPSGVADALKGIGINAEEMSRQIQSGTLSTFGAIQQVSQALKAFPPQSKEVGAVLTDVFGKKGAAAGYDAVAAFADLATSLEEVKKQTGQQGEVTEELINATRNFENSLSSLFGVSDSGFSHLTDLMKIHCMNAVSELINKFIDLYNKNILLRGAIQLYAESWKQTWNTIKFIIKEFAIALTGIGDAFNDMLTGNWDKVGQDIKKAIEATAGNVTDFGKEWANNFADLWNETLNGKIEKIETVIGAGEPINMDVNLNIDDPNAKVNQKVNGKSSSIKNAQAEAQKLNAELKKLEQQFASLREERQKSSYEQAIFDPTKIPSLDEQLSEIR